MLRPLRQTPAWGAKMSHITYVGHSNEERFCYCCWERIGAFEVRGGYPRPSVYCWSCAQDLGIDCLAVADECAAQLARSAPAGRECDEAAHYRCEG